MTGEQRKQTWKELVDLFQPKSTYRYKWCEDCIIELRVPTPEEFPHFTCNEKRLVRDKRFAKYRSNAMYVLRIWDLQEKKWKQRCNHTWMGQWLVYGVGHVILPFGYEPDIDEVCAPGIHYFQTFVSSMVVWRSTSCV
jgi:hypothetical protein